MSSLLTYLSNIWTSLTPAPPKRRSRRIANVDPDCIEPINHWFPGNRTKKQPRRLVETPTAGHWPEFRVAKNVVGKGRKRCAECGALVKEVGSVGGGAGAGRVGKGSGRKMGGEVAQKKTRGKLQVQKKGTKVLRGRSVEYDE